MQKLPVEGLYKRYGSYEVLKGVSLTADACDVIAIIGATLPSRVHTMPRPFLTSDEPQHKRVRRPITLTPVLSPAGEGVTPLSLGATGERVEVRG
jgi:ABC-type lipopolysaccharide export system ATPase subunit